MTGRVILITGGNSGIGYEAAKYLCEGGNNVVLACRDTDKGEEAVQRIKNIHPNSLVECMELDLASSQSIREFADTFARRKKKLHVLINNAGMALNFKDLTRRPNGEGHEITMATNHLGPFLLTNLLLDYIVQTANIVGEARIVNVTCGLHDHENNWLTRRCDFLDMDNFELQKADSFSGIQAYKNSKLCNVLFTYDLAERLKGTHVTVNAVDPGVVPGTQLSRQAGRLDRMMWGCCMHKVLHFTHKTNSIKLAATQVCNLADSEKYEGKSGKFFRDGVEDRSSIESYDKDLQQSVFKLSGRLMNVRCSTWGDDDLDDISLGNC